MFRHIRLISAFFVLSLAASVTNLAPVSAAEAESKFSPPTSIQTSYEATKNGQPFAKVRETFTITDNTYKLESITKGVGVYALFGERKLTSTGEVTAEGLKPTHFELHQGDNAKKSLIADFDWAKNSLRMTAKGKVKDVAMTKGTQDLASFAYQFMFISSSLKEFVTVALTTGKKLNQYQYKISAEELDTGGTLYKTLHLVPADKKDAEVETKELWLAPEFYYLPIRILLIDENGAKVEQTLTDIKVE